MNRLRQIRKQMNLSQQQVADLLRISRKTYGIYERGERTLTVHMLCLLKDRLHITVDQLLDESVPLPVFPASTDEEDLIRTYRKLDPDGQEYIRKAVVREAALSELYRRSPRGT